MNTKTNINLGSARSNPACALPEATPVVRGQGASLPAALGDASLQSIAGIAVFARGLRYASDDRCVAVREGDAASEWLVEGGETYRVTLELQPGVLRGSCTCPHAEEVAMCKHVVAAAVAWRALLAGSTVAAPAAEADPVRAFLESRPAAELAGRLVAWAARDRTLAAELKAWRAREQAGADPSAWKEAINAALRKTRSFYGVADSGAYARQGHELVPLLQALVRRDTASAREACVLALRRIFQVSEQADDSNGTIGDLLHAVHAVLLDALRADPPTGAAAQRWLRTWVVLQERDPWGLWDDQAMIDAAGPAVLALYSRHVAREWEDWLARHRQGGETDADDGDGKRWQLRSRYLADRRHAGDSDAVLAALRADLRGAHEVVELAGELQALGREREALQALEQGARAFRGDWRIEEALLAAYERDGCLAECLAIRRAQLERRPDVAHYAAALKAAAAAGRDPDAYRLELHRWAEQAEAPKSPARREAWRRNEPVGCDVTVRVQWLLHDGRPEEALALLSQAGHLASEAAVRSVALAVRSRDWRAADALFRQLVEARMRRAQTPYREELELAREWLVTLPAGEAAQRLEWLRGSYRAKRNFVAGLQELAPR
jgi:hypothetical protein